jgi:hypothetical protein
MISNTIHNWFEIIFGNKQHSEESRNIYIKESYESFESEFNSKSPIEKEECLRKIEFGVCPTKVFYSDIKKRNMKCLKDKTSLINVPLLFESVKELQSLPLEIKVKVIDNKKYLFQLFNDQIIQYSIIGYDKYKEHNNQTNEQIISKTQIELTKPKIFKFKDYSFLNKSFLDSKPPLKIFNKSNTIVFGGYWSGEIMLVNLQHKQPLQIEKIYQNSEKSRVTCIELDSFDSYLACGTEMGFVFVYQIKSQTNSFNITLNKYTTLTEHKHKIVDIVITNKLNLLVSLSVDGYAAVYTFPAFKLINLLFVHANISKCIISSCPLPCFVFLVNNKQQLKTYSINGHFLNEIEVEGSVTEFKAVRDIEFSEYLLCGLKNPNGYCEIQILNLPYLEKNSNLKKIVFESKLHYMELSEDHSFMMLVMQKLHDDKFELVMIRENKNEHL